MTGRRFGRSVLYNQTPRGVCSVTALPVQPPERGMLFVSCLSA